jgi:hypothetical protein
MVAIDKIQLKFLHFCPIIGSKKAYPGPGHLESSEMWVGFEKFPVPRAPSARYS